MNTPWFIRARLRTRHLQLLTAIGEEGNIQRAAELLNMSQSAASRLLSDVEEIIGSPLFDRLARGVRANWYGQSMVRHARIALASLSEAAREIDLLKSGRTGQVNIGAIAGPAFSFVPRAIARMAREYPLVRLQLQVESDERLLEELQHARIDVMVGRLPDRHDTSNYHYQKLADEPACVAVRRGHPLERSSPPLQELASSPWILPPIGTTLRHRFELMFRDAGLTAPNQTIEAASPMVVTRLMEETDYLSLLSRDVADYHAACGLISVLPVSLACGLDSFGLVTRKDLPMAPATSHQRRHASLRGSRRPKALPHPGSTQRSAGRRCPAHGHGGGHQLHASRNAHHTGHVERARCGRVPAGRRCPALDPVVELLPVNSRARYCRMEVVIARG